MASTNDITGDNLISLGLSPEGEKQFEKIFGVKKKEKYIPPPLPEYSEDWQSEQRDRAIAQNGNVGYTEKDIEN